MAIADWKDWEQIAAKERIVELLAEKPMSPSELSDAQKTGLYCGLEEIGELLQDAVNQGQVRLAGFKISYLAQLKPGPSGILEAFFETVR